MKTRVRIPAVVLGLLGVLGFAAQAHAAQVYCLRGTSNGAGWAWKIVGQVDGGSCKDTNVQAVASGSDANALAARFAESVRNNCGQGGVLPSQIAEVLPVVLVSANCPDPSWQAAMKLNVSSATSLFVAPAGTSDPSGPPCTSGGSGQVPFANNFCNFNPDIAQGYGGTPALSGRGRLGLVLLIVAGASVVILRRLVR